MAGLKGQRTANARFVAGLPRLTLSPVIASMIGLPFCAVLNGKWLSETDEVGHG